MMPSLLAFCFCRLYCAQRSARSSLAVALCFPQLSVPLTGWIYDLTEWLWCFCEVPPFYCGLRPMWYWRPLLIWWFTQSFRIIHVLETTSSRILYLYRMGRKFKLHHKNHHYLWKATAEEARTKRWLQLNWKKRASLSGRGKPVGQDRGKSNNFILFLLSLLTIAH